MKLVRTKQALWVIITILLVCGPQIFAAVPPVLQQMPKDAMVVIASQRLDELGKKLDAFTKAVGLPVSPDKPLNIDELLAAKTGISGLDQTQSAGFAVLGMDQGQNTIFYLPVSDASAVLNSVHAQKSPDNPVISVITNPQSGQEAYASPFGKYLCIAENPEALTSLATLPKGVTLSNPAKEVFDACDIAAKINLESLMPMAQGMISMQMMQNPAMQQNPAQMQVMKAYMDRLGELQELTIGLQIAPTTLLIQSAAQAKPETKLAQYMANQPVSGIQDLASLPDQPFNFAAMMNVSPELIQLIANEYLASVMADPQTSPKLTQQNADQIKALLPSVMSGRGIIANYVSMTASSMFLNMAGVNFISNADQALKAMPQFYALTKPLSETNGTTVSYQAKAGTAAGKSYDEATTDMSNMSTATPEVKQAIAAQFGGQLVIKQQFCKLDNNKMAFAMGKENLESLLNFAASEKPGLDKNAAIATSLQALHPKANIYAFLHLGNFARTILSQPNIPPQAMMMGGMLTQVPGVIGSSVLFDNGAAKAKTAIPNEMIQFVANFIQQMQQMQQPPQQGPAAGPSSQSGGSSPSKAPPRKANTRPATGG